MWIGAGICVASAAISWLLSRHATQEPPASGTLPAAQREALEVEEGELAAAGLVGPEGD